MTFVGFSCTSPYDRQRHDAGRCNYIPVNLGEIPDYYRRFMAAVDTATSRPCRPRRTDANQLPHEQTEIEAGVWLIGLVIRQGCDSRNMPRMCSVQRLPRESAP